MARPARPPAVNGEHDDAEEITVLVTGFDVGAFPFSSHVKSHRLQFPPAQQVAISLILYLTSPKP